MTRLVNLAYSENAPITPVAPLVYTKKRWSDAWALTRELTCVSCSYATGMTDSQAKLRTHYGEIIPAGSRSSGVWLPQSFERQFVKIVFVTYNPVVVKNWYGVILSSTDTRCGDGGGGTRAYGNITYQAHGLEWFLHNYQVTESWLYSTDLAQYLRINRGIPFNGGAGRGGRDIDVRYKNRSTYIGSRGSAVFNDDLSQAAEWDAFTILLYLKTYFQPWINDDLTWTIDGSAIFCTSWSKPRNIETHGRTLRQIIDDVVDAKRGLTYYFELSDDEKSLVLYVDTILASSVTLPSGSSVLANSDQLTINMETRRRSPVTYTNDTSERYQQVMVQGAFETTTQTVTVSDGTLVEDWTDDDELRYRNAAKDIAGYAALDLSQKQDKNDNFRQSDSRAARVFTHFRIPRNQLNNFTGTYGIQWIDGVRLSLLTPMLEGFDYTVPDAPVAIAGESRAGDYADGLCFAKLPSGDFTRISELGHLSASEKVGTNGLAFTVQVRAYDSGPGIIVNPTGPGHCIARGSWSEIIAQPTSPANSAELDYQEFRFTVTSPTDARVTAVWPDPAGAPVSNQLARHVINIGDDVRQDWVKAGTAIGVNADGTLQVTYSGGYVRNDIQYAKDVARMAYEWYQVDRQAVRFDVNYIMGDIGVNSLVESMVFGFGATLVNTVVTSIEYDFTEQSTTINTDNAEELDFRTLAAPAAVALPATKSFKPQGSK